MAAVDPDVVTGGVPPVSPSSGASPVVEPVDWRVAERVAHRVAGREPLADSYHHSSLEADFAEVTTRAAALVSEFTGLEPEVEVPAGVVLDRQEWASANLRSFRKLLAPVTDRLASTTANNPIARFGTRVAGVEAGALLGWFARRVLGQYDLFGGETLDTGSVYYVGPNVLGLEKRHGFRPRDFRMWIALHEVTHLVQFTGVPWLRAHFQGLVDQALSAMDPDPQRVVRALRHVIDEVRAGRNPLVDGGLVNVFASDEERELLREIQAFMALLEGHGNYVMDRLGAEHVDGQAHMSRVLRERRQGRGVGGQIQKVIGIELKLRQYAVGEQFLSEVERVAGPRALDTLWEGPGQLPDLDELRHPGRWLARTGTAVA